MDFSNAGKRRRLKGPTLPTTLAFTTLAVGSGLALHENVKGFPLLFETHLPNHRVHKFDVKTKQFGGHNEFTFGVCSLAC